MLVEFQVTGHRTALVQPDASEVAGQLDRIALGRLTRATAALGTPRSFIKPGTAAVRVEVGGHIVQAKSDSPRNFEIWEARFHPIFNRARGDLEIFGKLGFGDWLVVRPSSPVDLRVWRSVGSVNVGMIRVHAHVEPLNNHVEHQRRTNTSPLALVGESLLDNRKLLTRR